jgi:hypothetical protein
MPKVRKLMPTEIAELEAQGQPEREDNDGAPERRTAARSTPYPYVHWWVAERGWIEIGYDDYSRSFIRVLDIGGMVWEGEQEYPSLDAALRAADAALADLETSGEL